MSGSRYRWSALAGIAAGLVTIAWVGLGQLHDGFFVLAVASLALLLVALPGLHGVQQGRDGRLGRGGFLVAFAGGGLVTVLVAVYVVARFVFDRGDAIEGSAALEVLLAVGFFGMLLGLVAFGVAALKAGVLPRWGTVLLLVGLPLGVAIDMVTGAFFGEEAGVAEWGFFIGVPLFALGLMAVSYGVLSSVRAPSGESRAPAGI